MSGAPVVYYGRRQDRIQASYIALGAAVFLTIVYAYLINKYYAPKGALLF